MSTLDKKKPMPFKALRRFQALQERMLGWLLIGTLDGIDTTPPVTEIKIELVELLESRRMNKIAAASRVDGVERVTVNIIDKEMGRHSANVVNGTGVEFSEIMSYAKLPKRDAEKALAATAILRKKGEYASRPGDSELDTYIEEGYKLVARLRRELLKEILLEYVKGYVPVVDKASFGLTAYNDLSIVYGERGFVHNGFELAQDDSTRLRAAVEHYLGPLSAKKSVVESIRPFNALRRFQQLQEEILSCVLADMNHGVNMQPEVDRLTAEMSALLQSQNMSEADAALRVNGVVLVVSNVVENEFNGPSANVGLGEGVSFAELYGEAVLKPRNSDKKRARHELMLASGEACVFPDDIYVNKFVQETPEVIDELRRQMLLEMLIRHIEVYDLNDDNPSFGVDFASSNLKKAYSERGIANGVHSATKLYEEDRAAFEAAIENKLGKQCQR